MGFDALDSNTTGSDNALASWIWRRTGSLNTARWPHTATLLQNGMVLVAGGLTTAAFSRAPNCTTRRAVPGLPQAASTPHAIITRRRCYKTAWSLLQGELMTCNFRERRTVRPGERDLDCHRQPQHRTHCSHGDVATKRHGPCCRGMTACNFPRAPNCTTRRAGPGLPQAASTPRALSTRRRCYKTAWSLLQGDLTAFQCFASAELYDPASGTWTATGSLNTARYVSHSDVATKRHGPCCRGSTASALASAELYDPASGTLDCHRQPQHRTVCSHGDVATKRHGPCCRGMTARRFRERRTVRPGERELDCHGQPQHRTGYHTATLLQNRKVLVAGGVDSSFSALASTEKGGKLVSQ